MVRSIHQEATSNEILAILCFKGKGHTLLCEAISYGKSLCSVLWGMGGMTELNKVETAFSVCALYWFDNTL